MRASVLSVQKSEWQSQVAPDSGWTEFLGKSFYAAGVYGCLNLVASAFRDARKVGMIRYVFEEGVEGRDEAERMLRRLKSDSWMRDKFLIGGYSFESKYKPEFVPLQAADFLAYESYRQIDNQILGRGIKTTRDGQIIKPRGALRCLLRADDPRYANVEPSDLPVPHFGVWLDRQRLGEFLSGLRPHRIAYEKAKAELERIREI